MKRALKFFLVFAAVAAAVYAMVIGLNYPAFKSLFANADGMAEGSEYVQNTYSLKALTEFIGLKPQQVSIASYNVDDPDSGIFYGADIPRTLGTLGNVFLLIEYERQVASGLIEPGQEVSLNEIESYALPKINQSAHVGALKALADADTPVTLDQAMQTMLQYNSLAISDYFWFLLGEENLRDLMTSLNLEDTEMPVPFSGLYTIIHPNLMTHPTDAQTHFKTLGELPRDTLFARMINAAEYYARDIESGKMRRELFENERLALSFIEERNALIFFPKTTARNLTDLLVRLVKNEGISDVVSENVKNKLRWGMKSEPILRSFSDYGAIYDNRMGLLSGIDFGTSIYDGHTSVQAVIFDELPVAFWLHMSANHMQEDYQQRLIWDPALYEATINQISAHK